MKLPEVPKHPGGELQGHSPHSQECYEPLVTLPLLSRNHFIRNTPLSSQDQHAQDFHCRTGCNSKNKHNCTQATQRCMAFLHCPGEMFRKIQNEREKSGRSRKESARCAHCLFHIISMASRQESYTSVPIILKPGASHLAK